MIFELGNEKVVITCQITYISPLGRISWRKATGIGLSGSREGPRNQTAGVEVSSVVSSSSDDSPSSSCASACHSSSRSWAGSSSSSSDGGTGEGSRRLLPPPFPPPSWVHPSLDPCLAPTRNPYRSPHQHPSVASFFCTVRRPIVEVRRPASFFNHLQLKIVNQSAHIYKTIL